MHAAPNSVCGDQWAQEALNLFITTFYQLLVSIKAIYLSLVQMW